MKRWWLFFSLLGCPDMNDGVCQYILWYNISQ
jgi:hypothetical protein